MISGTPVTLAAATAYTVTATNSGGSATESLVVDVVPPPPPVITAQPMSQSLVPGESVKFSVAASGTGALSYQWEVNGVPILGANFGEYWPTPRSRADSGSAFTVVVGDTFGGATRSNAAILTVLPGFWPTGSMSAARTHATATRLPDGKVLVAGGDTASCAAGSLASAELFDPTTLTFSVTGSMAMARGDHTATLFPNGKVLIAGGRTGCSATTSAAEIYDPSAGAFSATGSMTTPRSGHIATLLPSGKVLIADRLSAEVYDPASGTFSATGPKVTTAGDSATLLDNGTVLIAGGVYSVPACCAWSVDAAEIYDPASGTFSATSTLMTVSRAGPAATLLPSGKVLIAGGRTYYSSVSIYSGQLLSTAEIYDPATGAFSPTASMTEPRESDTAILLPSGAVLIVGGWNANVLFDGAELFDPGAQAFSHVGGMPVFSGPQPYLATKECALALLQDGRVLCAGGGQSFSNAWNTSVVYE